MADNPTVDNPTNGDIKVSADEVAGPPARHVQRVKLAYSGDGVETHIPADADGLLVNLGTNNDVIVADGGGSLTVDGPLTNTELRAATVPVSGTITANAGTGTQTVGGVAATDAAVSGNPLYVGGRASTATPTAMSADNDIVPAWSDRNGAQMVRARPAATATLANVAASVSSVTLRASNTARLGLTIVNDSAAICYVKLGSTASTTSFTYRLDPGATLELPASVAIYTGIVTGIWTSATGNARVTEVTT